uniref:Protein kinase domain-containing protein n=1 Tax=Globodera rostochiensis TaxID=31243 RepID=A0A914HDF4_GLORO
MFKSPKIALRFQYFGQQPKGDAEKEDNPKEDETTAADDKEEKREDEMSPLCSIYDFKDVRGIGAGAFASVFYGEEMVSLVPASNRNFTAWGAKTAWDAKTAWHGTPKNVG